MTDVRFERVDDEYLGRNEAHKINPGGERGVTSRSVAWLKDSSLEQGTNKRGGGRITGRSELGDLGCAAAA
jgi:hypothetical protein